MLEERALAWICEALALPRSEILSVRDNPNAGKNNATYILETTAGSYLYREPGIGTERFCSREREFEAYRKLSGCGLVDEVVGCDVRTGRKLSVFYPGSRVCDPRSPSDRKRAMELLRRFHELRVRLSGRDDPCARLRDYAHIAEQAGGKLPKDGDFLRAQKWIEENRALFRLAEDELRPVHADCLAGNVLFRADGSAILIDLEFASMGCIYGDIADFCHDADLSEADCISVLEDYLGRRSSRSERSKLFAYCACIAAMWAAWADFKACTEQEDRAMYEDYRDMSVRFALASVDRYARNG